MKSAVLASVLLFCVSQLANAQVIPNDAKPTCTIPEADFKKFFKNGSVELDGMAVPADSVAFREALDICVFYRQSAQMFLWVTSPTQGGKRVFDGEEFFDVSPPDRQANGARHFIPHTPSFDRIVGLRVSKPGPDGLPVVLDKQGRLVQIAPAEVGADGQPLVVDNSGKMVEVETVTVGADRKAVFLDRTGQRIDVRSAAPAVQSDETGGGRVITARRYVVDGQPILVDAAGNVVDAEVGQADRTALIAQNGSLIYYTTIVNDVFAYFLTAVKGKAITPGDSFPTTQADLDKIIAFGASKGKRFAHPKALAIELKMAWVESQGLANPDSYITTTATIPTFDKSNGGRWVQNGQKTAQLALLGIHVVGSVNGHPEMIWATFEHFGNTPNGKYSYDSMSGPKTVSQDTSGTWLLSASNAAGAFNKPRAHAHPDPSSPNLTIVGASGGMIGPSNTLRSKAWGAASDVAAHPLVTAAASNTKIISLNHNIRGMMPSGDVRNNYFLVGATWTLLGSEPNQSNHIGTTSLANTTMETFQQGGDDTTASARTNCFSCHRTNKTAVSRIFDPLKPLF